MSGALVFTSSSRHPRETFDKATHARTDKAATLFRSDNYQRNNQPTRQHKFTPPDNSHGVLDNTLINLPSSFTLLVDHADKGTIAAEVRVMAAPEDAWGPLASRQQLLGAQRSDNQCKQICSGLGTVSPTVRNYPWQLLASR
ncbi:hypothetical protein MRX96_025710 [Rhipicephalus microplus]